MHKLLFALMIIVVIVFIGFFYWKASKKEQFFSLAYSSDSGVRGPYTGPCTPDGCSNFGCNASTAAAPCGPILPGDDYMINPFVWPGSAWPAMSAAELVSLTMPSKASAKKTTVINKEPSAQEKFLGKKNTYIARPITCRRSGALKDTEIKMDNLSSIDYGNNYLNNPKGSSSTDMGLACQSRETILRASPTLDKSCYSKLEDDSILGSKLKSSCSSDKKLMDESLFSYILNQNSDITTNFKIDSNHGFVKKESFLNNGCNSMDRCQLPTSIVRSFYANVSNPDVNIRRNVCTGAAGSILINNRFSPSSATKFIEKV
jgi:hypothetical protein